MVGDFKLLQDVYMLWVFNFTVLLQFFLVFCFNSKMNQFCLRNQLSQDQCCCWTEANGRFVLKVNIKENGRRKAALRAPIFHCAVSNWTVYITVWWIKNKPLLQNVIAKIVCELCSPLRSVNDSWSKRCIWGDFLGLFFNIYTFSVNLRSHNYYPLVSVDVG